MKINEKNWTYYFFKAGKVGFINHLDRNSYCTKKSDICTYFWNSVKGFFVILAEILIASLLLLLAIDPIASGALFLFTDDDFTFFITPLSFFVGSMMYFIGSVTGSIYCVKEWNKKREYNRSENVVPPGKVSLWLESIRNKICIPVEVKNWFANDFYRAGMMEPLDHFDKDCKCDTSTDICTYIGKSIKGFFVILYEILIGVGLTLLILDPIITALLYTFDSMELMPFFSWGTFGIGTGVYALFAFLGSYALAYDWWSVNKGKYNVSLPTNKLKETDTGKLVRTWYKSFKEKTCLLIEIEKSGDK